MLKFFQRYECNEGLGPSKTITSFQRRSAPVNPGSLFPRSVFTIYDLAEPILALATVVVAFVESAKVGYGVFGQECGDHIVPALVGIDKTARQIGESSLKRMNDGSDLLSLHTQGPK